MKVGVVLDEYFPRDGGAYTLQSEVLRALLKLVDETRHQFVIISRPNKQLEAELSKDEVGWLDQRKPGLIEKINGFLARNWPNLRARTRWSTSLERRARQQGIEFLWFLGQRPQETDLPYMAIVFDLQHRLQPWFPEVSEFGHWDIRERTFARHLRRAAAIIAGTQAGKAEITGVYQVPEDRVFILPHPTPDHALNAPVNDGEDILARFDLKPGYLFYPAQYWAHKNHVNLLLALKQLRDEGIHLPLVLTGSDFGNRPYVQQKIQELDLGDEVRLLGFVSQGELLALYRGALALTYLSFFGPENLPPLEAFALGCPVIAARVDGSDEQLGDAAVLVNPSDTSEIASAIRKVYEDHNLRDQLVARGRLRAARWTAEDFVRGVFKILDGFEPVRRTWK